MPVHDWRRVQPGIFHDFHNVWCGQLRIALNSGLLPADHYALIEQHTGPYILDILTLNRAPAIATPESIPAFGIAVAEAPPKAERKLLASASRLQRRRTIAIRHTSGHRLVGLIEIVSPANKDRASHVHDLADKVVQALRTGIHVVLVDLFPPGSHDERGMHGVIWEEFDDELYEVPADRPLTVVSYVGGEEPEAYVQHLGFNANLPEAPLFLHPERYIALPLEATYSTVYASEPAAYRDILEGRAEWPPT